LAQIWKPLPNPLPFVPHGERDKTGVSSQQCMIQWQRGEEVADALLAPA